MTCDPLHRTHGPASGWRRLPSVTYGGAPEFWHRRTSSAFEWYAFDRIARAWRHTREPFAAGEPVTHVYAPELPATRSTRKHAPMT